VVDLGNPAALPVPVDAYANLAATGLKKAPEPAAARKVNPGVGNHVAQATSSSSSTATLGTVGKVSLKDKMKRQEASAQRVKEKRIPIGGILLSVFSLLILALVVFIWDACIFNRNSDLLRLKNCTNPILNRLTSNQRQITDQWWNDIISKRESFRILGSEYSVMDWGFKEEVSRARKELSYLEKTGTDLQQSFEGYVKAEKQGILGEIITQISSEKKAADHESAVAKAAQEEADRKKKEAAAKATPTPSKKDQSITLKIGENMIANSQALPATNGQTFQLDAISSSGSQVSINATGEGSVADNKTLEIKGPGAIILKLSVEGNEQVNAAETNIQINIIPPAARITKIEFFDNSKTAWEYFFNNTKPTTIGTLPGWRYCQTNGLATNLTTLLAVPFTAIAPQLFTTNYPILNTTQNSLTEAAKNTGSCFFRKDDKDQEITLTITTDKKAAIVNMLDSCPIVLENSGGHYNCSVSTNLSALLGLIRDKRYKISYEVGESFNGDSLENLTDHINKKIKSYEVAISQAKANLEAPQKTNSLEPVTTASQSQDADALNTAGVTLSAGLKFKSDSPDEKLGFPEDLKTYSNWMRSKSGKARDINSYQEYLQEVFNKISTCEGGLTFTQMTREWLTRTRHPHELFDKFASPDTDPNKSITLQPCLSPKEKSANDAAFIQNAKLFFTLDNNKRLDQFLASPKPTPTPRDYKKELHDSLVARDTFIEKLKNYRSKIQIKDLNNTPVLIFTSP
jgi:predicted DNA binding CopG/RHH family protein